MTKLTTPEKKNKKVKAEKNKEVSTKLPPLNEIITKENLDALIKIINESIPKEKIMISANKIIGEIYSANREPQITRTYKILDEGGKDTVIRHVTVKEDGCFKECILEKYNLELDIWEHYERPNKTIKEIAKEVDEIEEGVKTASYDLDALSKMIYNSLSDSIEQKNFDYDLILFLSRTIKDLSEKLYKEGEKLELMDFDFRHL